jgi:hypothetical protein
MLDYILGSRILNKYFLQDRLKFLHYFTSWFLRYSKIDNSTASLKILINSADLTKSLPESMFWLTDFAVRTPVDFRKPLVYCESGFVKPLCKSTGGFQ